MVYGLSLCKYINGHLYMSLQISSLYTVSKFDLYWVTDGSNLIHIALYSYLLDVQYPYTPV